MVVSRREFLAGLGLALAAGTVSLAANEPPVVNRAAVAEVVKGNNAFAFDLYAQLGRKQGNLFLSPNSISTALAMTYTGARGETASQMASVLHFPVPAEQLNPAFAGLVQELQSAGKGAKGKKPAFQLNIANALWGQKGYRFRDEFIQTLKADYGAGFQEVDFQAETEAARQTINAWVEKRTQDKIKELFKPGVLDDTNRLVLTNAIYFKGSWQLPFKKNRTKDDAFYVSTDKKATVAMMHQQEHFRLLETEKFQAIELPYAGGSLFMTIVLPRKKDGLAELEPSLTQTNLKQWLTELDQKEVKLFLPRFKVTAEFKLNDVLSKLGMSLAFTPFQADFSGMDGTHELFISAVVHKAFVDVNEEGTEAAAATGVGIALASAPVPQEIPVFRADHPFFFLIRDARTDSILFMGRVTDPT
jgi:serpin B